MASPEAKARRRDEAVRALEVLAEEAGTPEEMDKFRSHVDQPVFGDFEMLQILQLEAARDLLAGALGVDMEDYDLSEEGRLYEYRESEGRMVPVQEGHETLQEAEAAQGQDLQEDATPFDERDEELSDEEVEASFSESDLNVRERNEAGAEEQVPSREELSEERAPDEVDEDEEPMGSEDSDKGSKL